MALLDNNLRGVHELGSLHESAEEEDVRPPPPETQAKDWSTLITPPASVSVTHPYLARYWPHSTFLAPRANIASNTLNTTLTRTYGNPSHPIAFVIGNGGAGYTGLFKCLCANFIWKYGHDFRIGWVANHSRHSLVALLGGVVQVALTYEAEWEEVMEGEGWGRVVSGGDRDGGRQVFWDHFILVGPGGDPAGLSGRCFGVREAMKRLAEGGEGVRFFSRGDGSATFNKEQQFWKEIGLDPATLSNVEVHPFPPYQSLLNAEEGGAYMLGDRSTYLTAKRDGLIPSMRVYVEGGEDLLNPCSVSVNTRVPDSVGQRLAVRFAEYLSEADAQSLFTGYGRVWDAGYQLFSPKNRKEFGGEELLVGA